MNYQEAVDRLSKPRNQDQKKVANNTVLYRTEDQCIMLRLHATNIIVYYPDGTMVLSSGGWKTVTTKARLNEFLPRGWSVWQEAMVWYLSHHDPMGRTISKHGFQDGVTIMPDGTVTDAAPKTTIAKGQVLHRKIRRYAKTFIEQLAEGEIRPPSSGDCWFCTLKTQGGKPLGEATGDTDHLDHHMAEGYYVPSLLKRAAEVGGVSIAALDYLRVVWQGLPPADDERRTWYDDIAKGQLRSALVKYMRRQYGLAS